MLETDSRSHVDALAHPNRSPVAPSPLPSFPAAGCRRHNPLPSNSLQRIRAIGSSPLNPCYLPVCSLSPVSLWFAPLFAAAVRRPFRLTPSSTSRRPAWLPCRRHVGARSTGPGQADPGQPLPPSPLVCARPTESREAARGPLARHVHREPHACTAPTPTLAPRNMHLTHGEPSRRQASPTRDHARWTWPTGSPPSLPARAFGPPSRAGRPISSAEPRPFSRAAP